MEISVDFEDGRIREYNTSSFTSAEPFKRRVAGEPGDCNLVTEFDLRLDLMPAAGLRLDVYFNTAYDQAHSNVDMTDELSYMPGTHVPAGLGAVERRLGPATTRRFSHCVFLLTKDELEKASYILVRRCGEAVVAAWRQGSGKWLINGQRFADISRQVYSDAQTTSRNAQELIIMNYLANAYPTLSDEERAAMTGYPLEAYEEIREMEYSNATAAMGDGPAVGYESAASGESRADELPASPSPASEEEAPPSAADGPESIIPPGMDFDDGDDEDE